MKKFFESLLYEHPNILYEGPIVDLRLSYYLSEKEASDGVACVYYDICLHNRHKVIGSIDLRLTMNEMMYYYGHIGYNILKKYQGHHYAYQACKLLLDIAKEEYHLKELIITCNPDNIASYKTIEKLGATLKEVAEVPNDHELYQKGDRYKCIFNIKL